MGSRGLKRKAVGIRRDLLRMISRAKAGHTGGSLSSVGIVAGASAPVFEIP